MARQAKVEFARGERVLPGLWRLRLALPLHGVPHVNAWAIRAGEGIVLVDCGMHELASAAMPASLDRLRGAMAQVGLRLEQVSRLVITHAHYDHFGQCGPVIACSGAELWMHPNHDHAWQMFDPTLRMRRVSEIGLAAGVDAQTLEAGIAALRDHPSGVAELVAPDHALVPGAKIATDLGDWEVHETPGHAPSHVCLYQPKHRLLISGDHLLGRVAPYFDYGFTPDPIGEFLASLNVVRRLDSRLALSGHGRPFTDVVAHIDATRDVVEQRLALCARGAAGADGTTALALAAAIYGAKFDLHAVWRLNETLALLVHLERRGEVQRADDGVHWLAV